MTRAPPAIAAETSRADLVDAPGHGLAVTVDLVEAATDVGDEAGHVAVAVDVPDLGQVVVVEHGERQHDLATGGRGGVEQVRLRPDGSRQRRDQLLADGVERRVGHLREHLREVVEQQPRLVAQRRDRGVGPHRPDRLGTAVRHRREQDAELLLGVAEDLLAPGDRGMGVDDVLALGQVGEMDQAGVQPLVVRVLGGELALDLVVLDDAVLVDVDQEHPAGLEPPLADDARRVEVEHADLGGEHDEAVVGDPVAAGTQAVAVEDGTDLGAVGEHHAGGAVPRLHQRGVELVERAALPVHLPVVLPGLRDHHQHRVGQAATAHVQQLQDLVEARGVRGTRRTDREQPLEVARDQVGVQQCLTGPHPVAVAHHGVDLAVVRDVAERVGQRPARERVGGEARVDDGERGRHPLVGEVGIEGVELGRGQHALVEQRPSAERGEVDVGLVLGALAQAEHHPLQRMPGDARALGLDEDLAEVRHHATGGDAHAGGVDRYVAPAEHRETLLVGELLDPRPRLRDVVRVAVEERRTDGVGAERGELEVDDGAEERVGNLDQDPGPVAGARLGTGRAAVVEVVERGQCVLHDVVRRLAGQRRHEGDAARVVLEARVVEPLCGWASLQCAHPVLRRRRPPA